MPRDLSGNYTLPTGNPVVDGTIIESAWANGTMNDIAAQLNNVLTKDGVVGPTNPMGFANGTVAAPAVYFLADPSVGLYRSATATLGIAASGNQVASFSNTVTTFSSSGAERLRLDSSGNLIKGHTAAVSTRIGASSFTPGMQHLGVNVAGSSILQANYANSNSAPTLFIAKSRGGTVGTHGAVVSGDSLGSISWAGSDGTNFIESGRITVAATAAPGADTITARMLFQLTNGTNTPSEVLRIEPGGAAGFGTGSLSDKRIGVAGNITGAATAYGLTSFPVVQSDVTGDARIYHSNPSVVAAAFTLGALTHFMAAQGTIGAGASVTSQFGFYAHSGLIGATNNYGFYSNIAAATGRWNFYANGTADNYMGGQLGVGVAPTAQLHVKSTGGIVRNETSAAVASGGNVYYELRDSAGRTGYLGFGGANNTMNLVNDKAGPITFNVNGAERMQIDSAGKVGVGRTPTAQKFEIAGGINLFDGDFVSTSTTGGNARFGYESFTATGCFNLWTQSAIGLSFGTSTSERMRITGAGVIQDSGGNELGFKDVPQNIKSAPYTLAGADRGCGVRADAGCTSITVPALPVNSVVTIYNNSGSNLPINQSGTTLRLDGTATTGNRTLAPNGRATLWALTTTIFSISGAGLS